MDALQCILTRRSCRSYEDRPIPKKEILELLTVGTKAATGSGMQPWGFVTLEGREKIAALSDEIKAWLKENFADFPWLAQYREWLDNPNYNIFYDANNVICVYGDTTSHWYVYDGTLCTANIMLAAHAKASVPAGSALPRTSWTVRRSRPATRYRSSAASSAP